MSFIKINLVLKTDRPTDIPKKPTKVSIEGTCSRYKCRQLQNRGKLWGNLSQNKYYCRIRDPNILHSKKPIYKVFEIVKNFIHPTDQPTHQSTQKGRSS